MNDAKTFLKQIRTERREIKILESKIREKRFELMPSGIRYDKENVQTSPEDKLSEIVAELTEYEEHLTAHVKSMYHKQSQALDAIILIPSSEQRQVLEEYYLSDDNPEWNEVASNLSYSTRQVLRIHGDALMWLNKHCDLFKK